MRTWSTNAFLLALLLSLLPAIMPSAMGQSLGFSLNNSQGNSVAIETGENQLTVICFLGTECPMARSYASKLNALQTEYASRGVQVLGVMSNRQDSLEDVRRYIDALQVHFEILIDQENIVADQYGATRTPEVYLLDSDLKLRYHGRIDDQYAPSVARAEARREDLRIAIEELLAGKPVSIRETKALGCIIGKVKKRPTTSVPEGPTFAEDVFPVLERNCIECHRSGEIGPFAMEAYEEVVGWADTMLETIHEERMPPWHADEGIGEFANARHMPEQDVEVLENWVKAGCPAGDLDKLPEVKTFADGWAFEPKHTIAMRNRPYTVPKDGIVEYQYFVVDPKFQEEKWVTAAQIIPGARDVVHHAIVYIRPPDGQRFRGIGWLAAYVPGQRAIKLPEGRARRIPPGSKLVFQMHYTPNGTERKDITRLGLEFGQRDEITHEVYTTFAINQDLDIPPNTDAFRVTAEAARLPREGELLTVTPHMHYRGKACALHVQRSNASGSLAPTEAGNTQPPNLSETVLSISKYDFNWQHTYQFQSPIPLETISKVEFEAVFDNSNENPFNPNADDWVYWGDQTWEEMAVAFFEVSVPLEPSGKGQKVANAKPAPDNNKINDFVRRVLEKWDGNGDGQVDKSEGSIFVRHFNFRLFDRNRDGTVSESEIRKVAERQYQ